MLAIPPVRILLATALALIAASAPLGARSSAADQPDAATVAIDSGTLRGELLDPGAGLRVFRGIPFAAPPVGELRWRPPAPPAPWPGERDATRFGAICPQLPMLAALTGEPFPATREDCLYLYVWTAAAAAASSPVMVWIHGGGLTMGWSNQLGYEGSPLARLGVVLVTINYRLGAPGFLDQIAALEWVRRNIAKFGGDPNNVTIFGESAGGTSVHALLASPLAAGRFHRAISQSAAITGTNVADLDLDRPPVKSAHRIGVEWSQRVVPGGQAPVLAELRRLPAQTLVEKSGMQGFTAVIAVDGWFMPSSSEQRFRRGDQQRVPLIAGTTADEGTMFQSIMPFADRPAFEASLGESWGEQAAAVAALYPAAPGEALAAALNRYYTEAWFLRGTRAMLLGQSIAGVPAYQYQFTRRSPVRPEWGAHHAAELGYVFGNLGEGPWDGTDRKLADAMTRYWVQFARTGDPNVEGLAQWPRFEPGEQRYLELGDQIGTGRGLGQENCDRLDAILRVLLPEA